MRRVSSSLMAQRPPKRSCTEPAAPADSTALAGVVTAAAAETAAAAAAVHTPAPPTQQQQAAKKRRPAYKQAPVVTLVQTSRRTVFQFPRIQQILGDLPICRYEFPDGSDAKLDQDELVAALRHASDTQRLILPCFTCAYESQLLRAAGQFHIGGRLVTFPECRFGAQCVGHATGAHAIPGLGVEEKGVTLMALLFEGELATLLDTGTIDLRGNRRPCLLCYRHLLCDFLLSLQPRHSAPIGSMCIQIYSNLQVLCTELQPGHSDLCRTNLEVTDQSSC